MTDIGFGWRCASYEGDEAQALLATFAEANQVTTWDDGGTEYSIKVRPLFPGEGTLRPGGFGGLNPDATAAPNPGPQVVLIQVCATGSSPVRPSSSDDR